MNLSGSPSPCRHLTYQDPANSPVGTLAIPCVDPNWNYQIDSQDRGSRGHLISCLIERMKKFSLKIVTYDKIREIIQEPQENPAIYMSRLTVNYPKYATLNLENKEG